MAYGPPLLEDSWLPAAAWNTGQPPGAPFEAFA